MHLWNDYEGKTLAGTFPIEMLLSTEGRNASFATHDRNGRPAVLRLTEALNDEQEMEARYGAIQDLGQLNLIAIEDFGNDEIEGTPLIYLVMESTEENLEDIVRERTLSIEETGEVAISLSAALEALHAHGLVHGQVEPASVFAAGQVIKLRSDCVRPAPAGAEGDRARAEDVFGLADVLNRALTQRRLEDASDALALPEPYASIVRNVVRGTWGLEQVTTELSRFVRPALTQTAPAPGEVAHSLVDVTPVTDLPPAVRETGKESDSVHAAHDAQLPLLYADDADENMMSMHQSAVGRDEARVGAKVRAFWLAGAAGVCLVALLGWHFADAGATGAASTIASSAAAAVIASPGIATGPPVSAPRSPAVAVETRAGIPTDPASLHGQIWRVVAYTYNVRSQAEAKAHHIAEQHAGLDPQVYSRTGHAPFLVTLGGSLTQQQAAATLQRARSQGLARDAYMQNYSH